VAIYRPDIPPHVAEIVRHLPPELKRGIKQALRSLSADPFAGTPLIGELTGLWRVKVRRFRIVYELDRKARMIRVFAIGHRREVYEEIADRRSREENVNSFRSRPRAIARIYFSGSNHESGFTARTISR
jgi:mRNA interferase RelE/StbE